MSDNSNVGIGNWLPEEEAVIHHEVIGVDLELHHRWIYCILWLVNTLLPSPATSERKPLHLDGAWIPQLQLTNLLRCERQLGCLIDRLFHKSPASFGIRQPGIDLGNR